MRRDHPATPADDLADEVFLSLKRHVMMARLAPAGGGTFFTVNKMQQALSTARYQPIFFDLRTLNLAASPSLTTVQTDNQLASFGPGSENFSWFNRIWLPSFYAMWEEDYRHQLAAIRGVKHSDVLVPYFGDLRYIRNDVVHKKGRVVDATRGRCSVLRWYDAGEEVMIGPDQYEDLFDLFPWEEFRSSTPRPDPLGPVDTSLSSDGMTMLGQFGSRRNPWS